MIIEAVCGGGEVVETLLVGSNDDVGSLGALIKGQQWRKCEIEEPQHQGATMENV